MHIDSVTKKRFDELDCPILFSDELTDRQFGVIRHGIQSFKFGWQSDTIAPFTLNVRDSVWLVGIDQNMVVIDFDKKKVALKISTDNFFYKAVVHDDFLYAITELEVLKIDIESFALADRYNLPDYFERLEFKDDSIEIYCMNYGKVTLRILE